MLVIVPVVPWMECGLIRHKLLYITCWSVFKSLFPVCTTCTFYPKTCDLFNNETLHSSVYEILKLLRINASGHVMHVKDKLWRGCSKYILMIFEVIVFMGITGWYRLLLPAILILTINYKDFENNNKMTNTEWVFHIYFQNSYLTKCILSDFMAHAFHIKVGWLSRNNKKCFKSIL